VGLVNADPNNSPTSSPQNAIIPTVYDLYEDADRVFRARGIHLFKNLERFCVKIGFKIQVEVEISEAAWYVRLKWSFNLMPGWPKALLGVCVMILLGPASSPPWLCNTLSRPICKANILFHRSARSSALFCRFFWSSSRHRFGEMRLCLEPLT
jgi:hypothetical protein